MSSIWNDATIGFSDTTVSFQSNSDFLVTNASVSSVAEKTWTTPDLIWIYVAPFILLTGVCGNILILLVMCRGRMRGTSTCVYLKTMALADLIAIITGVIPDWLTAQGIITLKEYHQILCKLEKFLFYTSADTSIWACVIFTIDRFVAVCFPMENMQNCPAHHAKYYALTAFIAAVGKNLHVLITRGEEWKIKDNEFVFVSNCGSPNDAYRYFEKYVRPWIAFTVVNLLPFLIIVFCNLFIVRAMVRLRRSHRQSVIVSSKDSNSATQMTVLCLSASICFLVCVTPSMILLIGKPYWSAKPNPDYDIVKAVGNLIFCANHAINFFLYCMTGRKFRKELVELFSRNQPALSRNYSVPRNSADLVFAYKLQRDRLGPTKGGKSGLYASAPCISDFVGGKVMPELVDHRTFLQDPASVRADRLKSSSDAGLMKTFVGHQSEYSLFGKVSYI